VVDTHSQTNVSLPLPELRREFVMGTTTGESNTSASTSKTEFDAWGYYVRVYRGKEGGGTETVGFEEKNDALEFGQREEARNFAVAVFSRAGAQIYHTPARSI
jgi:hypothetical protein